MTLLIVALLIILALVAGGVALHLLWYIAVGVAIVTIVEYLCIHIRGRRGGPKL